MKDYRKAFPFSIGTTSYILPVEEDNLIRNAEFLSGKVDKVQLLFFGKNYLDEMLAPEIMTRLLEIKKDTGINYSVHLPLDLGFLDISPAAGITVLSRSPCWARMLVFWMTCLCCLNSEAAGWAAV